MSIWCIIKTLFHKGSSNTMYELNFVQLVKYYIQKTWILILSAILGAMAAYFYTVSLITPLYESESTVILNKSTDDGANLTNNYITLLKSRKVIEPIISARNLDIAYTDLISNISIENQKSTEIINITVTANDPELAQNINSDLLASFNLKALGLDAKKDSSLVTVIDSANISNEAININVAKNVFISSGVAIVIAIIALFIIFDTKQSREARNAQQNRQRSRLVGSLVVSPALSSGAITSEIVTPDRLQSIRQEANDNLDLIETLRHTPQSFA